MNPSSDPHKPVFPGYDQDTNFDEPPKIVDINEYFDPNEEGQNLKQSIFEYKLGQEAKKNKIDNPDCSYVMSKILSKEELSQSLYKSIFNLLDNKEGAQSSPEENGFLQVRQNDYLDEAKLKLICEPLMKNNRIALLKLFEEIKNLPNSSQEIVGPFIDIAQYTESSYLNDRKYLDQLEKFRRQNYYMNKNANVFCNQNTQSNQSQNIMNVTKYKESIQKIILQKYNLFNINNIQYWRKINGDGNCFYRSVIFGYIERLILGCKDNYNSNLKKLKIFFIEFYDFLKDPNNKKILTLENVEINKDKIIIIFYLIIYCIEKDRINFAYNILNKSLNNYKFFDFGLILFLRYLIKNYIQKNENKLYLEEFPIKIGNLLPIEYEKNDKFLFNNFYDDYLMKFYKDAEKIVVYLTPFVLNTKVKIVVFDTDSKDTSNDYFFDLLPCPKNNEFNISISILNRKGHYDILYLENEYNMNKEIFFNFMGGKNYNYKYILCNNKFNVEGNLSGNKNQLSGSINQPKLNSNLNNGGNSNESIKPHTNENAKIKFQSLSNKAYADNGSNDNFQKLNTINFNSNNYHKCLQPVTQNNYINNNLNTNNTNTTQRTHNIQGPQSAEHQQNSNGNQFKQVSNFRIPYEIFNSQIPVKICSYCKSNSSPIGLRSNLCSKCLYNELISQITQKFFKVIDTINANKNYLGTDILNSNIKSIYESDVKINKKMFNQNEIIKEYNSAMKSKLDQIDFHTLLKRVKSLKCLICKNEIKNNCIYLSINCGCCFCSYICLLIFFNSFCNKSEINMCLCGDFLSEKDKTKIFQTLMRCSLCSSINDKNNFIYAKIDGLNTYHYLCLDCYQKIINKKVIYNCKICNMTHFTVEKVINH